MFVHFCTDCGSMVEERGRVHIQNNRIQLACILDSEYQVVHI